MIKNKKKIKIKKKTKKNKNKIKNNKKNEMKFFQNQRVDRWIEMFFENIKRKEKKKKMLNNFIISIEKKIRNIFTSAIFTPKIN